MILRNQFLIFTITANVQHEQDEVKRRHALLTEGVKSNSTNATEQNLAKRKRESGNK